MLSLCVPMVDCVYIVHKFVSNNKNVINSVAESERAVDVKDLDLSNERLPIEQALGIKWNVEDDVFCFKVVGQRVHLLHGAVCFPSWHQYLIRWDVSPLSP